MRLLWRRTQAFGEIVSSPQPSEMVRLSKWMSLKALCSRREAEEFIELGLVRVDGKRVFENMLVPVEANLRAFTPLGLQLQRPVSKLWMINKPRGYICTHRDPQKRSTVYDLFPPSFARYGHLMTVGRLDYNSEGLLLVTNDNTLKGLLENPAADLTRVYRVKVHGRVTPEKLQRMNSSMTIKERVYGPLNVNIDRQLATNVWLNVSMRTGKNREIRRIMQKCDLQVNKLVRVAYGPYKMGSLNHAEIAEIPISQGLERKLKLTKAKELRASQPAHLNCLIEVDIRNQAVGLAKEELRIKELQSSQQKSQQKILPAGAALLEEETEDE